MVAMMGRAGLGRSSAGGGPNAAEDRLAGWIFITPAMLIVVIFVLFPILFSGWVSLHNWDTVGTFGQQNVHKFIGIDNYKTLFHDNDFWLALRNTVWYTVGVVPVQTVVALFLAVLANRKIRGISFFRTAFYFPSISSSVVIALIFTWLYSGNGFINTVLRNVGIDPPRPVWLANPNGVFSLILGHFGVDHFSGFWAGPSLALFSIMLQNIWASLGGLMVVYLAGLQNVPGEVYEAASLDGASRWRQFVDITVPLLRPITFFVLTVGTIGCFQVFDQIYIMSNGGPAKTTTTVAYLVYTQAFQGYKLGYASAIALVLFVIILIVFLIQRRIAGQNDLA